MPGLPLKANPNPNHGLIDQYNAMQLPTIETLGLQQRTNPWLAAVCYRATQHASMGYGGVEIIVSSFSHKDEVWFSDLRYEELVSVIPCVRRMGYTVNVRSDRDMNNPFSVGFGRSSHSHLKEAESYLELHAHEVCPYRIKLHGTSPAQIRRRGLIKCVPRLLGWLRQARINLADPRRPGAIDKLTAERAAELADTDPPHWKAEAADAQDSRKRKLVDALHASEADRRKGARWFNVRERGVVLRDNSGRPMTEFPMRIEALAGGWHYVFQRERNCQMLGQTTYEVIVLHHDAFDLVPWAAYSNLKRIGCEWEFARQFEDVEPDDEDEDEESE